MMASKSWQCWWQCWWLCWWLCCLAAAVVSGDSTRIRGPRMKMEMTTTTTEDSLMLPSNATSIRENITDTFSCENRTYGYYADVDNDCQIFHVCLPVTYADGRNQTFRWSFICPESTLFNQEYFVCVREEDMTIACEESPEYYSLNDNFGNKMNSSDPENDANMEMMMSNGDSNALDAPSQQEDVPDVRRLATLISMGGARRVEQRGRKSDDLKDDGSSEEGSAGEEGKENKIDTRQERARRMRGGARGGSRLRAGGRDDF